MTRKACLVGINDYSPVGPGGPDLRGCVPDVRDVAHTLNVLGIVAAVPTSMRIITDARATRANILEGFRWLIRGAKKGDVLVFYYSGHGSQVLDVSGDDTVDKKDETICPHDYAQAGMIKDDDLRALLAGLPAGVNLDVIFDSCHSGTATREVADLAAGSDESLTTARYVAPPLDWGYFLEADPLLTTRRLFNPGRAEAEREVQIVPGLNHVLWAACRDYQTSMETRIGGTVRGVFTYCFCRALRRGGAGVTRRRLDSLVSADIAAMGFAQVPQLEGMRASVDQRVFT